MSNRCGICSAGTAARAKADAALLDGATLSKVAQEAGVSIWAVKRHRDRCPPLPGVVPPAPPPVARPTFDAERLLRVAVAGVETNIRIATEQLARAPGLASAAAYRATLGAAKLLEIAGAHHRHLELRERLDDLRAELDRREVPTNGGRHAAMAAAAANWSVEAALARIEAGDSGD